MGRGFERRRANFLCQRATRGAPSPTRTPWIIATIGCRHRAIAPIVASSTAPYFFASLAFLRVVSNSAMSARATRPSPPAQRLVCVELAHRLPQAFPRAQAERVELL